MSHPIENVLEFHLAVGIPVNCKTELPDDATRQKRVDLLQEEMTEYLEAEKNKDVVEIADALADIVYIALGTCLEYGIPFGQIFREVHRSNMTKLGPDGKPTFREDGKVLKPETFEPPRIKEIIESTKSTDLILYNGHINSTNS